MPIALGTGGGALELMIENVRSRRRFGRAISEFQLVQRMVAHIYAALESLPSVTYAVGAEVNVLAHGEKHRHVAKRAVALVLRAGRKFTMIADRGVQAHGGAGYIRETGVNRLCRASKLSEIGAATTEIRQLIITRELLG